MSDQPTITSTPASETVSRITDCHYCHAASCGPCIDCGGPGHLRSLMACSFVWCDACYDRAMDKLMGDDCPQPPPCAECERLRGELATLRAQVAAMQPAKDATTQPHDWPAPHPLHTDTAKCACYRCQPKTAGGHRDQTLPPFNEGSVT